MHRFPAWQPTSFVGRQDDLQRLEQQFANGQRLVTIVGSPGLGKTRLASQLVANIHHARVCALTEVTGAEELERALILALGRSPYQASDAEHEPLEYIAELLAAEGELLLVLDNCEHLLPMLAECVLRWLQAAPALCILATSREALGLDAEQLHVLEPLDENSAVDLLRQRGQRVRPDFAATATDKQLRDLVNRLDRIPLAIELCACRARLLTVSELLRRLSSRFRLLVSDSRGGPSRHATLAAAIQGSWDALEPWAQLALQQCALFRGGFSMDAAEACIRVDDANVALDLLHALMSKSLLHVYRPSPGSDVLRIGVYESIRAFALEQPLLERVRSSFRQRHADYYLAKVQGLIERRDMASLALESDNMLAITEHFSASDPLRAASAMLGVEPLLSTTTPFRRHLALVDRAIEASRIIEHDGLLGRGLSARAALLRRQGLVREARADIELAHTHALASNNARLIAEVTSLYGDILGLSGESERAEAMLLEAVALHRGADTNPWWHAQTLGFLGQLHHRRGDLAATREYVSSAITIFEELGDLDFMARFRVWLGDLLHARGDLSGARELFESALDVGKQRGAPLMVAMAKTGLATLLQECGEFDTAREFLEQSRVSLQRQLATSIYTAQNEAYLAILAHETGTPGEARARLEAIELAGDGHAAQAVNAFVLGHLGALMAESGELEDAERKFVDARLRVGDSTVGPVLEILSAFLLLGRARESIARGNTSSAEKLLRDVRAQLATRSVAFDSADTRAALRLLSAAADRVHVMLHRDIGHALSAPADGSWFMPPGGGCTNLHKFESLRRIMCALVDQRQHKPGHPLSRNQLVEAAWPGDKVLEAAAANRLWVALSRLRKLGLGPYLLRGECGYFLDPEVPLRIVSNAPPSKTADLALKIATKRAQIRQFKAM